MTITTSIQINYNTPQSDKHKHTPCNNNDKVNEVSNQTHTSNNRPSEPKNSKEHQDSNSLVVSLITIWTQNDYHEQTNLLK